MPESAPTSGAGPLILPGGPPEPASLSVTAALSALLGALVFFTCFSGIPAVIIGRRALREIRFSDGLLRGRRLAITGIALGLISCLLPVGILLNGFFASPYRPYYRIQCVNNLKFIALAMGEYEKEHSRLPPSAILDKEGRPLLSWRVAILPFLGCDSLYAKFHLDEPWNSPHNRPLIEAMPEVYACPSHRTREPGTTGYLAVIGPDTAFTPVFQPLTRQDFTDGADQTILIGESLRNVLWTKPDDLPFDTTTPFSGLGSHHGYRDHKGFHVALVEGSVRFLKMSISSKILRSLLTRSGGEKISPDSF